MGDLLTVHLVRHGQSQFNAMGRVQGHTNSPLTPQGHAQARATGEALRGRGISAIYTSDLLRARQTADEIGRVLGIDPQPVEGLREVSLGEWEGKEIEEIRSTDPHTLELWYASPMEARIPGAEPLDAFRKRVISTFGGLLKAHPHGEIVVVSHGGVLSVIIADILQMSLNSLWRFRLDNASISRLLFGLMVPKVTLLNSTAHLDGLAEGAVSLWSSGKVRP
jgi:broad specificity phosphatase PhoE